MCIYLIELNLNYIESNLNSGLIELNLNLGLIEFNLNFIKLTCLTFIQTYMNVSQKGTEVIIGFLFQLSSGTFYWIEEIIAVFPLHLFWRVKLFDLVECLLLMRTPP